MRKIERELNRLADTFGFLPATTTSKGHLEFRHGGSNRVVFFSGTPGDRRAVERLKMKFRAVVAGWVAEGTT